MFNYNYIIKLYNFKREDSTKNPSFNIAITTNIKWKYTFDNMMRSKAPIIYFCQGVCVAKKRFCHSSKAFQINTE